MLFLTFESFFDQTYTFMIKPWRLKHRLVTLKVLIERIVFVYGLAIQYLAFDFSPCHHFACTQMIKNIGNKEFIYSFFMISRPSSYYFSDRVFLVVLGRSRLFLARKLFQSLLPRCRSFQLVSGCFSPFLARCILFQVIFCFLQVVLGRFLLVEGRFRLLQVVSGCAAFQQV